MKSRKQGGRFLHHNQGQTPKGRASLPLWLQKGQRDHDSEQCMSSEAAKKVVSCV